MVDANLALQGPTCNTMLWVLAKLGLVMIPPFLNDETSYLLLDPIPPSLLALRNQFLQPRKAKLHQTDIDGRHSPLNKTNMAALTAMP
jgi:hypothetical protein